MDTVVVIPVEDLTPATFTRARGTEAFQALVDRIQHIQNDAPTVLVDISNAKMLSASFLDELVLRVTSRTDLRPDIGFRVGSEDEISRLERVCSVRQVACIYQLGPDTRLRRTRILRRPDLKIEDHPGTLFES